MKIPQKAYLQTVFGVIRVGVSTCTPFAEPTSEQGICNYPLEKHSSLKQTPTSFKD
jgi:hypothetical protein